MAGILERESAHFENRLLPKPPWSIDKMDRNAFDKMLKAIMPCAIELTSIDGTWKLNQTKTDDVRVRAAGQIEAAQVGYQTQALARFQRDSAVR